MWDPERASKPVLSQGGLVQYIPGRLGLVLNALERLGDGDLLKVKQIFEQDKDKKSRMATEDKILAMAYILVPEVSSIDNIIPQLYKAKMDLINTFTEAFADEFNYKKGNDIVFDCDGFLPELKDLLSFRKGHRKGALYNSGSGSRATQ